MKQAVQCEIWVPTQTDNNLRELDEASVQVRDRQSIGQLLLLSGHHLGSTTRFLLLSVFFSLHVVRRPPCREDGSVIYLYY
jgi:hypothetical protein